MALGQVCGQSLVFWEDSAMSEGQTNVHVAPQQGQLFHPWGYPALPTHSWLCHLHLDSDRILLIEST